MVQHSQDAHIHAYIFSIYACVIVYKYVCVNKYFRGRESWTNAHLCALKVVTRQRT